MLLALLVLGAALALSACGDDDDLGKDSTGEGAVTNGSQADFGDTGGDDGDFAQARESAASADFSGGSVAPPITGITNADLLGRTIIRNGSVSLVVESVDATFQSVTSVATSNGGFVADSTFWSVTPPSDVPADEMEASSRRARLTLRVPAERFDAVLADLRALAVDVSSVSTSSQDVTEEFTDLESQLRNMRAIEATYIGLLDDAQGVEEIFLVQDRLNQTRAQIEQIQGRINLLDSLSDLATLHVELVPVQAPPVVSDGSNGPLDAAAAAWEASLVTIAAISTVVLVAVVYSWWLIPFLIVAIVLARRYGHAWRPAPTRRVAPIDTPGGNA